jgi:hypothetical protein
MIYSIFRWLPGTGGPATLLLMFLVGVTARAEILTTTFASNGGAAGNMFDTNVLAPRGITVQQLGLNLDAGVWNLEIFSIDSPYAGFENDAAAWTLRDSITGLTSVAPDSPTLWNFEDFPLRGNATSAIYVTVTNGSAINYTNGTAEGAVFASDNNLQILEGTGNAYPFGVAFRPRIWNGDFHYQVNPVPEPGLGGLFLLAVATACSCRRTHRAI